MANTNRERNSNRNSVETILTFENRDISQWSTVWSTNNVPGMDNAAGSGPSRRVTGRRRLRTDTLALGAFLIMHCRVTASALTGGFFVFMMFLILSVIMLANPLRHFEIYLGQWSISGPGRAFRIIPMLDGIGIAICINAVIRAITCCTIAAISAIYVIHSVSDDKLPFTYCRNFELKAYEPILKNIKSLRSKESRFSLKTGVFDDDDTELVGTRSSTVGLYYHAWRNVSYKSPRKRTREHRSLRPIEMCNETYSGSYPPLYSTPAYNFFYVEVVQLRKDYNLRQFNVPLVLSIILTWIVIWVLMISEHISHGKLIWNNMYQWLVVVPWCWIVFLIIAAVTSFLTMESTIHEAFHIGAKEVWAGVSDALQVALYIHSASVGTEIILGKGLNHYASGHIDPQLNKENVWHSGFLLLLITLQSGGVAGCALVDYIQPDTQATYDMHESTMWVIPMYSKCTSFGNYSHFLSTLVFGGLTFSYMTTAFILLKTALHTIFEIRVKLIFIEQFVVGGLILICMGLSLPFATNGGIILLESVDAIMTGVAMPFVCLLELVALLYVYGSHDFISDMNTATEENVCSSRIGSQWKIIPFITVITIVIKISVLVNSELPVKFIYYALVPFAVLVVAIPLRACHNAYFFLVSTPHRNT